MTDIGRTSCEQGQSVVHTFEEAGTRIETGEKGSDWHRAMSNPVVGTFTRYCETGATGKSLHLLLIDTYPN